MFRFKIFIYCKAYLYSMITREQIIEVLKKVNDPEIMVDVWTLELIYDLKVENDKIDIKMTFTTPLCPYGPMLLEEIKQRLNELKPESVNIEVVFSPPWQPSEELRATLGV